VISPPVTPIAEKTFIACIEKLMTDLAGAGEVDEDLQSRSYEVLMEGYGWALALEGQRRRLRERQLKLADLPEADAGALSELAGLARREARLGRQEGELRSMLAPLRERERGWQARRVRT
jgi:hypothetical protein